jgi:type II secretory pathway pseudopilin PulG
MGSALKSFARAVSALAEVIVVVTIIALLAATATTGFLRARKHRKFAEIRRTPSLVDSAADRYAP